MRCANSRTGRTWSARRCRFPRNSSRFLRTDRPVPWHVEERNGRYCVIKNADSTNEGCHDTREEANRHMAALYANESESDGHLEFWDGPAAMRSCDGASDFRKIAFELANDSDPDTQAHWALPHHPSPGAAADPGGVSAALGRLDQTGPTVMSKDSIRNHLEAHQSSFEGSGEITF